MLPPQMTDYRPGTVRRPVLSPAIRPPVHPVFFPRPVQRYPWEFRDKDMTIAAGFPYQGGVLLCADTQHETPGSKVYAAKIGIFECPVGKVGFAYAGNTEFSVAAIQKCSAALKKINSPEEMVPRMEEVLDRQYRRTVFAHPDNTNGALWYRLLFSIWRKDSFQSWLFSTYETTCRNSVDFECIGAGSDLANYFFRAGHSSLMSEQNAVALAAYMLSQVAGSSNRAGAVPGCGGPSFILLLRNNGSSEFRNPEEIFDFAAEFDSRSHGLYVDSLSDLPDLMFDRTIEAFIRWLRSKRAAIKAKQPDLQSPTPDPSAPQPSPELPGGSDES